MRVHNPTDQVQTIYVDPIVDLETPLEFWDVQTASGLIVRAGRRDLRATSRGRFRSTAGRNCQGYPLVIRFRYAVLDDPPRALKVAGARQGRAVPFDGFARPWLDHARQLYKLFGHHIQPGKTKVFKAALELRPVDEPSSIDSVLKPATDRKPPDQGRRSGHPRSRR